MESCLAETCATATAGTSAFIFTQLIQTLLVSQCTLKSEHVYPADRTEDILRDNTEFDFIVAGGGSAGSVVASRLSEIADWRVLLIERGDDPSFTSDVPALLLLLYGSGEDYFYKVEPNERYCQGMTNKQCIWAKGKALGGSSVINAMLHVRGNDRDYDKWAELGNAGWSYKDVLSYFRKAENYHPDIPKKYGEELFGTGGPLTLRPYNYSESGLHDILLSAAAELGLPIIDMLNGDRYVGFGKAYGTINNGIRQNAAKAYLTPALGRKNLYVIKSARVDKVLLDGRKSTGVRVTLKDGRALEIKASKEVILSAGSIESPHILMLSGIGPKEQLQKHDIPLVADLPVGRNLQDHVIWLGVHLTYLNATTRPVSPSFMFDWSYEYLLHRKGEFASVGGVDLLGFLNTKDPNSKYPNIEFHHSLMPQNHSYKMNAFAQAFNYADELANDLRKVNEEGEIIFVCPVLLNPKSNGFLTLRSDNPADQIEIHANYFEAKEDVDTFMESLDIIRSYLGTKTFKELDIKLRRFRIPGCEEYATESRDYWECNLRHTAASVYHPVGTCKMGAANNGESVVDSSLKVHNIQGLRVIDASIMPEIPSGNTHAPTLMIAEKGSDLIKNEWLRKTEL